MTKEQFLEGLNEDLEFETPLDLTSDFKNHEEWDSMGAMILIGYVSNTFNMTLNADDMSSLKSVNEIITKIGTDKFD